MDGSSGRVLILKVQRKEMGIRHAKNSAQRIAIVSRCHAQRETTTLSLKALENCDTKRVRHQQKSSGQLNRFTAVLIYRVRVE